MPRRGAVLATLFGCALVAAGCSFDPNGTHVSPALVGHFRGVPRGVSVPAGPLDAKDPVPIVTRGPRSDEIYLVTWGSSSCPDVPGDVLAWGTHQVVVRTVGHDFFAGDTECTGDLAPTTSVVRLPDPVDGAGALEVTVDGRRLRLPAGS